MPAVPVKLVRLFAALVLTCPASCGTARFYAQAVRGQMTILQRAKPAAGIVADPRTPAKLRRQLELVAELCEFARTELRLPVKKQFATYADLGRPYAVFNVYAAPEFSMEAKTWWYPLVGRAKYRGFFEEKLAREKVAALKREGFDVYLGGVRVYSTLGWFADPVLNTFIEEEPAALAETIFHELTHARVFIRGDSDFNEAFATANAQEGVRRWLRAKGDAASLARYERGLARDEKILQLLERTREKLRALYAQKAASDPVETRRLKAGILDAARREYAAMKSRGEADRARDTWFSRQFNNARLASIATYYDLVPAFTRMLRGRGGDLEGFYGAVGRMKAMNRDQRRAALLRLTPPGSAARD